MRSSVSFDVPTSRPEDIQPELSAALRAIGGKASGAMLFVSGTLGRQVLEVARVVRDTAEKCPTLVVVGSGVLTERAEYEQVSAAAGVLWRGGSTEPFLLETDGSDNLRSEVLRVAERAMRGSSGAVGLFASNEVVNPSSWMQGSMPASGSGLQIFGGGATGRPAVAVVTDGDVRAGDIGGIAIRGFSPPVIKASPACQLLGELLPITEIERSLVLRIGELPALEVLRAQAQRVQGKKLIVLAVDASGGNPDGGARPRLIIRGIQGVHETRGALMISEELALYTRIAFAVVDADAARRDLELSLRDLAREVRGAAPVFGLYVNCAARGSQLYGESNVDGQLIRSRWPGLPVAGMTAAYEIAPGYRGMTTHMYSGVMSVFSMAS